MNNSNNQFEKKITSFRFLTRQFLILLKIFYADESTKLEWGLWSVEIIRILLKLHPYAIGMQYGIHSNCYHNYGVIYQVCWKLMREMQKLLVRIHYTRSKCSKTLATYRCKSILWPDKTGLKPMHLRQYEEY